jgi:hypothetical protein
MERGSTAFRQANFKRKGPDIKERIRERCLQRLRSHRQQLEQARRLGGGQGSRGGSASTASVVASASAHGGQHAHVAGAAHAWGARPPSGGAASAGQHADSGSIVASILGAEW